MVKSLAFNMLFLPCSIILNTSSCFAQVEPPYLNRYKIINATTLTEHTVGAYTGEENEQTHIITTAAIKEALVKEGVDPSAIEIKLYFDYISISDSLPLRKWDLKSEPNTVSSPWLELTETATDSGEKKIIIRIDATYARLIYDLFSEPLFDRSNSNGFLEIPSIRDNCLGQAINSYPPIKLKTENLSLHKFSDSFNCVPEQLKKPLLSLFKSSEQDFIGSFELPVFRELEYHCQSAAREYYSELYPRLAVRALHILESESKSESKWWKEVVLNIEPIQDCQKPVDNQFNYSY